MDPILADLRRSLAAIEAGRARTGPSAALQAKASARNSARTSARALAPTEPGSEPEAGTQPGEGAFAPGSPPGRERVFGLGLASLDAALGPLPMGALHEILAASQNDAAAASGFGLALLLRALAAGARPGARGVIVRQSMTALEFGELHGAGLLALGADPGRLLLVRVRDALSGLQAGLEALRSGADEVGAVALELWGDPPVLDLDATRRLAVAARQSGVPLLLLRAGGRERPSAAHARWRVAAGASAPLAAGAPGHPVFLIELLRHRAGRPPQTWRVEWSRDERAFRDPSIPWPVAALSPHRPAGEELAAERRAG